MAECLPFPDAVFDATLAALTVHHWRDRAAGLTELRRVARQRVVILPALLVLFAVPPRRPATRGKDRDRVAPPEMVTTAA